MSVSVLSEPREQLAAAPSPVILNQLETTRGWLRGYQFGSGLVRVALVAGGIGLFLVWADWMWVLSYAVRAVGLLGIVGSVAVILGQTLGRLKKLQATDAAVALEQSFPELGQRVCTSLDYLAPTQRTAPASRTLVEELVRDTSQRTADLEYDRLIPWHRLFAWGAVLAFLMLGVFIAGAINSELRTAAARLLLFPAHYTALEVKPGDEKLKEGSTFKVLAKLSGRPVRELTLRHRFADAANGGKIADTPWTTVAMGGVVAPPVEATEGTEASEPVERPLLSGQLESSLTNCQRDLEYQVVTGDIVSPVYRLTVIHPLKLKSVVASTTPPAYTKKKPSTVKDGNLRVIAGSRVDLKFEIDRQPKTARIEFRPKGKPAVTLPLEIKPATKEATLAASLPSVVDEVDYQMIAESADGERLESPSFRIRVTADAKPTIQFVEPEETLEVHPVAEVDIRVAARDDFGVAKVGLVYKIGDGPEETLLLKDFGDQPPAVEELSRLYLEKHKVTFNDAVTYRAFVEDNLPTEPHRVETELRFIDIRPFKRTFQMCEGGSCCSGASVTLEELIVRQRLNLNRSFAQREVNPVAAEILKRLTTNEEELAAATLEFAEGMAQKFGPVPELDEAAAAMQSATEQLQREEMPPSVASQERALAGLVKARKNLRQKLQLQSKSQCEECRKFDQQQQQKLRPPKPKKKEEETVQLGDDVKKLAKKQRKFSEELNPKSKGPKVDKQPEEEQQAQAKKKSSSSNSSSSSSSSSKSESDPEESKESLEKKQNEAKAQAEELQKRLEQDESLSELARERMKQGAESIRESADALGEKDPQKAAEAAEKAAEQLEELARQIEALKTPDLNQRVGQARDLAQQLAQKQGALSRKLKSQGAEPQDKPGQDGKENSGAPGGGDQAGEEESGSAEPGDIGKPQAMPTSAEQRRLAEAAKTLNDLLARLQRDAAESEDDLGKALEQAEAANSPGDAAGKMEKAADNLQEGKVPAAAREATEAAETLQALAADLDSAHRGLVRATLDQLLALEQQAAEAAKALENAKSAGDKAAASQKLEELTKALGKLAQPGKALQAAAEQMAATAHEQWSDDKDPRGNYVAPQASLNGLKRTMQVLQAQIQAIVLRDAVLDQDGPVPPEYKRLVEEYYKSLSEDLR